MEGGARSREGGVRARLTVPHHDPGVRPSGGVHSAQFDQLDQLDYSSPMTSTVVPTIDFSPAKSHLSDVMTEVFHGHQPRIVSRHRGKEQMLLVRPDDLVKMLGEHDLDVRAVYDAGEVTLRIPDMGVLGFGETLDEAVEDLLVELRAYATRFFREPARFMATSRGAHAAALLRFALANDDEQRRMLGLGGPAAEPVALAAQ